MEVTTTAIQKYYSYKESDVAWLGEIPEHWELKRFKHLFKEKKITHNVDLKCGSISFGKVVYKDDEKIPVSTKKSYQVLNKGEFLINPLNLNYDLISLRIALSDKDVVVSSGYIVVQNKEKLSKSYFKWLLHIFDIAYMKTLGSGVRQTLSFTHIANSELVFPPLQEQVTIAQFLDDKTAKIDQAIAIKQQQIDLLKERKQILIHKAVTRGLDENVTLKDSGVEWIGEIPAHWEVKRANYIFDKVDERSKTGEEELLSVSEHHGVIPRKNINVYMFQAESYVGYKLCKIDDLVINSIWAWSKGLAFSKHDGIISVAYSVFRLKNNSKYYPDYLNQLLRTDLYSYKFFIESKGIWKSRLQLLDWAFLRFEIISQPLSEQKEIANYIETASAKIETAINLKEQEIERLKEYKSSLIKAVVTGKVKVC